MRSGPVVHDNDRLQDFEYFMSAFHHQMYGQEKDFTDWQIDGEDPILEVESIESKTGKGRRTKYLVKWKGSDDKTWEPVKHLKGCEKAIQDFESKQKKAKLVYSHTALHRC